MSEEKDTRQEYWGYVTSVAADALSECEVKSKEGYEEKRDDVTENIDQSVDGSYWVIYYHASRKVMEFTSNDDALIDAGMEVDTTNGFNGICTQFAYFAMRADVEGELSRLVDDLPDEDPEEAEEEDKAEGQAE